METKQKRILKRLIAFTILSIVRFQCLRLVQPHIEALCLRFSTIPMYRSFCAYLFVDDERWSIDTQSDMSDEMWSTAHSTHFVQSTALCGVYIYERYFVNTISGLPFWNLNTVTGCAHAGGGRLKRSPL